MAEHVVRVGLPGVVPTSGLDVDAGRILAPDLAAPVAPDGMADAVAERALLLEAQRIARLGSWTFDFATGSGYLSDGLCRLCGLSPRSTLDELIALVHPDDMPALNRFRSRLATSRSSQPIELEVRDLACERTYLVRARTECDAEGKAVRVHGTVQDFTKFRAMERQLSQDGRLFREAQRVARLGTWEWNTETNECLWSSMLYELGGVEPGTKITYADYMELVHPDDRGWVDQRWQELASTRRPVECEHRVIRPDGKRRVFRIRGEAAGADQGDAVMIGTAQDVTEQRSTETRMQRSSKRFTDLVAITPVGIALFDDSERLVDANDALCSLLGMDLDRLRGMTAEQLTHPDDRDAKRHGTHSFHSGQRVLITAAGKPVYCELNATVSVADDGKRFWLVVFADVTDRRRTAERLRYQATHDELTGLPGRAAVKELLAKLLGGRDYERIALLFCDVDNFKRVNDSLGHDVGDELITALARRLERGLPPSCTVARMSGDEYVVICSDVDEVGGVEALANLAAKLLRTAVPVRGQLLRVSACIGAAVPSGPETSGADLLRYADAAMFAAKERGTGRVSLASDALIASANSQMLLEGQLREAIANDQLVLHYQPVVGPDGTVLSAEALVRWPHPERGLLLPGEFLPVAEQGDLLGELDRWVLRAAFTEAAEWPQMTGGTLGGGVAIAVNLAGLVPGDPEFVEVVTATVAATGIAWDRVVLELVETSLIDLPSRSREAMGELVERGVRFAVDDFGTGYSSLARLKELPAQIIKIDRRFVSGVATDASDFAVARALVDMARAMGRSCVAEGVENATQFHVLRGVGVDAYQGWLLSRPLPAREFREMMKLGPVHIPSGT
ncbi:bifunctional diguanylate cyclase/phosphodiesterase [Actinokineospora sp. HUAS TT18]|uniref:bifunctional diguanylate cyclase/phosphodiesterase n=1 Tax=Actinokineospora sp. HUAS TT18 TaxID=3447451 RepID=UPI003F51F842